MSEGNAACALSVDSQMVGAVGEEDMMPPLTVSSKDGSEPCTYCPQRVEKDIVALCKKQHVKVMCEEAGA